MSAPQIGMTLLAVFVSISVLAVFMTRHKPAEAPELHEADDRIADLEHEIAVLTSSINKRKAQKKKSSDLETMRTDKRNEILRLEREFFAEDMK